MIYSTRMHSSRMHTAYSSSCLLLGLSQCMLGYTHTQGLDLEPLGVGMGTPAGLDTPLGVGLETPLARPLNIPSGCGPGDHPPVNKMTSFAGGNYCNCMN